MNSDARDFLEIIEEDVDKALEILKNDDNPYNRRVFIKQFYSYIEESSYYLRQSVIEGWNSKPNHAAEALKAELGFASKPLSEEVIAVLKEESYSVRSNGTVDTQTKFLSFEQSFKFTYACFFRDVFDYKHTCYSEYGWQCLIKGNKIRNRVTHPKRVGDLVITDEELKTIHAAKEWKHELWQELFGLLSQRTKDFCAALARRSEESQKKTLECKRQLAMTTELLEGLCNYEIKYPYVIYLGFLGENQGIEVREYRYLIFKGQGSLLLDPEKDVPAELLFPVRFIPTLSEQEARVGALQGPENDL